ncbi:hypothetical protein ALI22I_34095 [Saccharothrix sp. ALI-22-I]|uniref:hypothetical protein n=1 Tax=Saccharothrix sp. ALI-22-I TaxID=1933778 RepID=UPI00097C7D80|nr:hypothetical protein [Saccharothrix sp. ALI-22-I]ONI83524.1 hypothetical protein ALI22I_34095 [Saccharothrix sp. ALI-22-I]
MTEQLKDWRGTPIKEWQTVIYGAPVGRSVAMVEGTVVGFTPSGRVWIEVKHRAYGGWGAERKPRVHVGPDRLTVVTELPPTSLPTEAEAAAAEKARLRDSYLERLAELKAGAAPRGAWETTEYVSHQIARYS